MLANNKWGDKRERDVNPTTNIYSTYNVELMKCTTKSILNGMHSIHGVKMHSLHGLF